MSIQASWLDKKWTIDQSGILALKSLSLTKELDVEEQEAKDGKNPINTKGYKPQSLALPFHVSRDTGSDPLQELESWMDRRGKRAAFHLAGKRYGPPVLILDSVEFEATNITHTGVITSANITLNFSEDVNTAQAPAAAVEQYVGDTAKPGSTPGYNPNANAAKGSAYKIGPSASAAESKY